MSDPFALLGLPRRPFLDDVEIGSAYRKLAGELHPDQAGGDAVAFRKLGEAAAILRDPARRLRELSGGSAGTELPLQAAELFPKVAALLQRADSLTAQAGAASNALAKALLIAPLKALSLDLKSTQEQLGAWSASLNQELQEIDLLWPECDLAVLAHLADSFAYASRWESQLRERELALDCLSGFESGK